MPTMRTAPALLPILLAAALPAQGKLAYSRFDFGNAYRIERADLFPNSRATNGNVAGDLLYKALPKEVFARDTRIRVSGVRISYLVDPSFQGKFPTFLQVPEVVFYPLVQGKVGGRTFDLPDLAKPNARGIPEQFISIARGGMRLFELKLGPQQPDPRLRTPIELAARDAGGRVQGWAVALLATPGRGQLDGKPNFVAVPTFGEIHRLGAPSAFSGVYDARRRVFLPYGTKGAPSNIGELAVELLLDQPSLQVFSDAAGGVRNDPRRIETGTGPGAYVNHLASAVRPGFFGLYCQWEGRASPALWCLPLVTATGPAMPGRTLVLGGARLLWDPGRAAGLTAFLAAGSAGPLAVYKAGGQAGHRADQNGVYVTARIPFPRAPALAGLTLWVQAVLVSTTQRTFPAATNLVRVVF